MDLIWFIHISGFIKKNRNPRLLLIKPELLMNLSPRLTGVSKWCLLVLSDVQLGLQQQWQLARSGWWWCWGRPTVSWRLVQPHPLDWGIRRTAVRAVQRLVTGVQWNTREGEVELFYFSSPENQNTFQWGDWLCLSALISESEGKRLLALDCTGGEKWVTIQLWLYNRQYQNTNRSNIIILS